MGCTPADERCRRNEQPRRTTTLSRGFAIMATEVTVGAFRRYAAATKRRLPRQPAWHTDEHPVVNVTWEDVRDFCAWAGGRLPTEAEWEYAARAGSETVYPWGDAFDTNRANGLGQAGADRWRETAPVRSFPPNANGLFDVVGNVWEWVNDWYWDATYAELPGEDPAGPAEGTERVLRGGSWDNEPPDLRVAFRIKLPQTARVNLYAGGRCARDLGP
jgi:formylglycine-generating enzyme required for sulfatase activity